MEKNNVDALEQRGKPNEKDLIVKLGPDKRKLADEILVDANESKQYKKKLSYKDLFEYLLKKYGKGSVADLIKLREQPEDVVDSYHKGSGTELSRDAWIAQRLKRLEELEKKNQRKKSSKKSQVNHVGGTVA